MIRITILLAMLLPLPANVCHGQQPAESSVVYVEGWRAGNRIREQVLNFHLDSSKTEHAAIVRDVGFGYYKLILRHVPAGEKDYQLEHWVVELRPVLSKRSQREKLGDNLLMRSGPGPGKDYFPKEDWVGDLFPREAPENEAERWLNKMFYPVSAKRVIKVENFYAIIQVNNGASSARVGPSGSCRICHL